MIKEEEIAYYRANVINKYVTAVMEQREIEEDIITLAKEFKRCAICHRLLPLTEFYKHSKTKDNLFNECKMCIKRMRLIKNDRQRSNRVNNGIRKTTRGN